MALELISDTTNTSRTKRAPKATKTRKPVAGGVVIRFEAWKQQRPTKNSSVEPHTTMVNAQGNWINSFVGLFDNSPIGTQVLENERIAREQMNAEFVMPE